jgi:ATP-dependent DNA helicase PIF1
MTNIDRIIHSIKNKENVLIHASGGTGKTFLLKKIAEECIGMKRKVACVAPTGVAALGLSIKSLDVNISGSTIHSWGGIGLGDATPEKLLQKVLSWPGSRAKWMTTDVLIMDEISMLGASLLDKLNYIGQRVRRNSKPFGGLQLIVGGDFLQLPPVKEKWAFKSMVWDQLNFSPFSLYDPQRYPDIEWFNLLLRVRKAQHTPEDIKFLYTRVRAYEKWKETMEVNNDKTIVKPTVLHSRKDDVNLDNEIELQKLESKEEITYKCTDVFVAHSAHGKPDYYLKMLDDAIPKIITLRVGAQVMLKANLDQEAGYVNGSRGVVVKISPISVWVKWISGVTTEVSHHSWIQEDKDGKMTRSQIPFILAWALTTHKAQGATLDYAICNLGPTVFCPGQAYVALSRVRSSDGLLLEMFYPKVIKADPDALAFAEMIETREEEDIETKAEVKDEKIDAAGNSNITDEDISIEDPTGRRLSGDDDIDVEVVYVMKFVGWKGPVSIEPTSVPKTKKVKLEKYPSSTGNPPTDDPDFQERFEKLKSWRASLAKEADIPAYRIINNATLNDICYYNPTTIDELLKIKGMGPVNIDGYGQEILSLLKAPQSKRRLPKNIV